jgi:two-component system, OmpR family, response regulator RstA
MARIMIIDDDTELADNTATLIRRQGHEVSVLYTTEDALRKVTGDKPDLVILDVMFPENIVAGFDLARQIRRAKATQDLPIILLTSVNQQFPMDFSAEDIDPAWMPVQDFVEKPVKLAVLLDKVNGLLKKR